MDIEIKDPTCLEAAARTFVKSMPRANVYAFHGPMGVGKTTFIKAVCHILGVEDIVTSPTFAIINEYTSAKSGAPIFHFDFYRVKSVQEACDMGVEEYFYSKHLCFIEWPEIVENLLPDNAVMVSMTERPDGSRHIEF